MTIEWRPIPGFSDYEVSNTGLVRSYKRSRPHILQPGKHPGGYRQVGLRQNGEETHVLKIGYLVLLAFRGPCPEGCEMCHNDGDSTNDHLDNLRWDTHAANMQDASEHGVIGRPLSRIPPKIEMEAFVNAVRDIQKEWEMTQEEFGKYIGVSQSVLSKFYSTGPKERIVIKALRKFPHLVHLL
jgi:hypothetical protein